MSWTLWIGIIVVCIVVCGYGIYAMINSDSLAAGSIDTPGEVKVKGACATVVSALVIIGIVISLVTGSCSSKANYDMTEARAWTIATDEVEGRLKAPSTADFCEMYEADITHIGDSWNVRGWVDAQNGFGATIRNHFKVVITEVGDDSYYVESVSIY